MGCQNEYYVKMLYLMLIWHITSLERFQMAHYAKSAFEEISK